MSFLIGRELIGSWLDGDLRQVSINDVAELTLKGSLNVAVDPSPTTESNLIDPPIREANCDEITKPRPLPPNSRLNSKHFQLSDHYVVLLSACTNGSNSFLSFSGSIPRPVSYKNQERHNETIDLYFDHKLCLKLLMRQMSAFHNHVDATSNISESRG